MDKRKARKLAESEAFSIGDLRKLIEARSSATGPSRVNPSLTAKHATDIFAAALAGRDDAEIPKAWRTDPYSRTGAMKHTRDALTITNILWECA
jgi:hypothetical protein